MDDGVPKAPYSDKPFLVHGTELNFEGFLKMSLLEKDLQAYKNLMTLIPRFQRGECEEALCLISRTEFRHAIALYVSREVRYYGNIGKSFKSHFIEN
mmetsp:Transcript_8536/g.14396  ORF Transcript_8536/g.14396 Transcript_8536/m.14396 type:complete len:97 (+) Transcript_8536:170-460(+)